MSAYKRKKGNSLTEGVSLFGYYQQQTARIGAITSVRAVRHFHIDALSVSILAGIKASIHYMLRARCRKVTICARGNKSGILSGQCIDQGGFSAVTLSEEGDVEPVGIGGVD